MADLFSIAEENLPFEENLIKNPYNVKAWLRYVQFQKSGSPHILYLTYERALKQLPGSYKLWYNYLKLRRQHSRRMCPGSLIYEETNNAHERALVTMHKMPRIWTDYLQFLMFQGYITLTRRTFDRALKALPITQHERIWRIYLRFADKHGADVNESCARIYRRYVKFAPDDIERFINFLMRNGNVNEAAILLAKAINEENFISREGKSKFQLWQVLCDLLVKNPTKVTSLDADAIIRQGISRYTDQVGILWTSLADFYIRSGNLSRARDVYAEAISTVITVRDFSQTFDAYAEFEQSITKAHMEALEKRSNVTETDEMEVELCLARLESLMERRPLLLNSVLLRQNPHNVNDWLQRVELLEPQGPRKQIEAFMEGISSVDPAKATAGRPSTLWIELARLYEKHNQLSDARMVLQKATGVGFIHVEDLASIWCEWAEMEIRHGEVETALQLLARAVTPVASHKVDYYDRSEPVQNRLHKSIRLWTLYTDLEESFGTFQTTKAAYDRMIDYRIATPQIIMNYGLFLEEHNYFEEAFKAYEKGVAIFRWPNVFDIWATYLTNFMERYGGSKLERARDLFEQCLEKCPSEFAKQLYLLYAKLEEDHGLARRAIKIYERATEAVEPEERFTMFNIYIQRIADLHGVTHTRAAYEQAIERLPEKHARQMCLRFADLERKLGEVDRARAVYAYAAQMCDPRTEPEFWKIWKEFELAHGNEDTLREMLRIKRSVQATYNTKVSFMASHLAATKERAENPMQAVESAITTEETSVAKRPLIVFKSAGVVSQVGSEDGSGGGVMSGTALSNPEAIDIDLPVDNEDEDSEGMEAEGEEARILEDREDGSKSRLRIEKQPVPSAVFGSLKDDNDD
ncbi:Pre-mRNA-splicing factor SYF1 [Echinococcus granulosus]|uniref:Pre-mRNA-splicing factor SYF1 n=1 Tax=Echinococcus granulosus TaxID=6210 RepID=U6J813_ECHGR|nr:Pre-mRNA-splicing factor SYF1 [Echinococcus granulosus]EUB63401.1 Pre-mRNA-splicing factor SYF1 [Echinococcus granulosus]CDS20171.1 pre mRNA splicing factor SYF1 [Echinococcus granulosus]